MEGLVGIITLLMVIALGLLITRIATVALSFTGLSRDLARFQARSAFTGCGFTTGESELIVGHPVRRRIVMFLMLLGNGVVVMAISSLIPVFLEIGSEAGTLQGFLLKLVALGAGLFLLWAAATSKWLDDRLSALIQWALKTFTKLEVEDYHSLLHVSEGYSVNELLVNEGDWVVDKTLMQLRLNDEGMQVLGIRRADGEYIGNPTGSTFIRGGDNLLVYGQLNDLAELEQRRADRTGDEEHQKRVLQQMEAQREQERQERLALSREEGIVLPDTFSLLNLPEDYGVTEMLAEKGDWVVGKTLADMRLTGEGMQILGIHRANGDFVGTPNGDTQIRDGDTLLVYGKTGEVAALEQRPAGEEGDRMHEERVAGLKQEQARK